MRGHSHWPREDLHSVKLRKHRVTRVLDRHLQELLQSMDHHVLRNDPFQEGRHSLPLTQSTRQSSHGVNTALRRHSHQPRSLSHGVLETRNQECPQIHRQCNWTCLSISDRHWLIPTIPQSVALTTHELNLNTGSNNNRTLPLPRRTEGDIVRSTALWETKKLWGARVSRCASSPDSQAISSLGQSVSWITWHVSTRSGGPHWFGCRRQRNPLQ